MNAGASWERVEEVFFSALRHEPPERGAYVEAACRGDESLRREVESLLDAHERAGGFIEAPAVAYAPGLPAAVSEGDGATRLEGRHVGPYRIERELGRGGMGAVYLARRADDEYRKQVAVKLIPGGANDSFLTQRFLGERQILANLDHPNIARLVDGGATEDGTPYLVMDYIEGVPLDEYCDRRGLSTHARLRLFCEVCAAVQHAHSNLTVHRDLKPSNILVTPDGVPKLLDFGIAKLLDPGAAHTRQPTATAARAMTPQYASPEQVRGEPVTTASDIYSLGVLLYELLTGRHPYSFKTLLAAEIERVICETDPERPSAVVTRPSERTRGRGTDADGEAPESVSRARGERPEELRRRLKGDLDAIVLMAMRKEPHRRYSSAAQFAEDIRRHLEGLPVLAHADTFGYRAAKLVRRHKAGAAAAAVVLLTLFGGIVATAWQAKRATDERNRAIHEAAKAERINAFLQNILGFSDTTWVSPNPRRNREATVADALDEAGRRAETELADHPEVLAAVRFTLGWTFKSQNKFDAAEPHLRGSLELRRKVLAPDHPDIAQSLVGLGEFHMMRGNYAEAESLLSEAVGILRRAREGGNVNAKWFAIALSDLGTARLFSGNAAGAEAPYREALEVGAGLEGADRALTAVVYSNLGGVYRERGDLDGAIDNIRKGIEAYRRLPGEPRWEMAAALDNLAGILKLRGEYEQAEPLAREALDVYLATVGEEHQYTPRALIVLADVYYLRGDYGRAREEIDRALRIQRQVLPESHVDFARSWVVLGKILTRTGSPARGETYLRQALERRSRALKPGHWLIAEARGALGECLAAQRRYDDAETSLSESLAALEAGLGGKDPRTREAHMRLVRLREARGNNARP